MIPITPVNRQPDSGLNLSEAPGPRNGNKRPSRLGSPLETASNGKAQIAANERRLHLGPLVVPRSPAPLDVPRSPDRGTAPFETASNGKAQIEANERRLSPPGCASDSRQ
jgi:hypothetical protein